ncbi:MAG: cytochrome [Leptolyngbya sp. SIOISBB]|nr:cytochrome [Leptolyngbya sp. SIOISBB]
MARILIGVMGPGESATVDENMTAYTLGQAIAQQGWGLLTGGRAVGVMAAASTGAQASNGWVVGILPDADDTQMSAAVDIAIVTGMGQGRNVINVLSSHVVIACGLGPGTLAEMALALKLGKPLILLNIHPEIAEMLSTLSTTPIAIASTVEAAIAQTQTFLSQ